MTAMTIDRASTGGPAPSTARYVAKKEAILSAATVVLNRQGVKGMTFGDVAALVGLIPSSVTYYFRRKEDLAAAALRRGVETFESMVIEAASAPDPRARLMRFIEVYLDLNRRVRMKTAAPLAYFSEIHALDEPQRTPVAEAYKDMFRRVRSVFDAPEFEHLSRISRNARTHLLIEQASWMDGWLHRYDLEDYDRVRDRMFDILVNGLAAPGQAWAPGPAPQLPRRAPEAEAFLKAATALMNKRGYRGASVDDIAAELHVTKGAFYHRLEAKDDLVAACVRRSLETLRGTQLAVRSGEGSGWFKLSTACAALIERQQTDYGPLLRHSVISALPPDMGQGLTQEYERLRVRSASLIADGVVDGSMRAVDPMIAAQMMSAMLNGGATLALWAPGVTRETAADVYVRPLLMGVFAR
jgi:AcrR family transcriptional regulator